MKQPKDFGEEELRRIAIRTRELMIERYGEGFGKWATKNFNKVHALSRCTLLAILEEFEK
jgi:hypothetical protein